MGSPRSTGWQRTHISELACAFSDGQELSVGRDNVLGIVGHLPGRPERMRVL
jgi:hypothetical protein